MWFLLQRGYRKARRLLRSSLSVQHIKLSQDKYSYSAPIPAQPGYSVIYLLARRKLSIQSQHGFRRELHAISAQPNQYALSNPVFLRQEKALYYSNCLGTNYCIVTAIVPDNALLANSNGLRLREDMLTAHNIYQAVTQDGSLSYHNPGFDQALLA